MKLMFSTLFLGIFLIPFYFFSSGKPQLSHLFFIVTFMLILLNEKKILNLNTFFKGYHWLYIFIFWTLIIGLIFFTLFKDFKTIMAPIYFIFNLSVMYTITRLYYTYKEKLILIIYNALVLSVITLFLIDLLNFERFFHNGASFYRKILTFNNPNQLGYWALSASTILFTIKSSIKKSFLTNLKFYMSILLLIYLSIISLSKAATISIIILILLNSLKNFKIAIFSTALMFITYNSLISLEDDNFLIRFDKRINNIGDANDDNLEGRGYLRISENPEYLFFGAGEGATKIRFGTPMELHSSFGTILFSYGILGLFVFLLFLLQIFKLSKIKFVQLLIPLLLYGITHMGIRFTLFWICLALFIIVNKKQYFLKNTKLDN